MVRTALLVTMTAALMACMSNREIVVKPNAPRPLSAIVVSECGFAVSLFIQLDATHLLRADPRQSDLFTAVHGKQKQSGAGPMSWDEAYRIASSAVLTTHVTLPCSDGPAI